MGRNGEQRAVQQQIFRDYCNKRDALRRALKNPKLTFTPGEAAKVTRLAREQFRQREGLHSKNWFSQFLSDTNKYFAAIKIQSWPSTRRMK